MTQNKSQSQADLKNLKLGRGGVPDTSKKKGCGKYINNLEQCGKENVWGETKFCQECKNSEVEK